MICKGEYELFFQNHSKQFFSKLVEFRNQLTIEYYEDTDFYEFWSIEIECSNQTISSYTLVKYADFFIEAILEEELNLACSTIFMYVYQRRSILDRGKHVETTSIHQ